MTTLPIVSELVNSTDHHGCAALSSVHENVAGSSSTACSAGFTSLICVADLSRAKFTAIRNELFRGQQGRLVGGVA